MLFVISLLRRLLSDSPQREFQMLTLLIFALSTRSLPRRIRNCKVYVFELLREYYGRVIFVLFLTRISLVVSVLLHIHPRYTHTPLYFIKSSMLRKYLKNESIGRWPPDVHHYTLQIELIVPQLCNRDHTSR